MEKKFLRILSFVMVAMFAFTMMGLIVGAEEINIPENEVVAEEEMGEEPAEEDFVEPYSVVTEVEAYFEVCDASGTHVGYYVDTVEALAIEHAFAAVTDNGYTVYLLKDYTFDKTLNPTTTTIKMPSKVFTIEGKGKGTTITENFDRSKAIVVDAKGHDNNGAFKLENGTVTMRNITFTSTTAHSPTKAHTNGFMIVSKNGTVKLESGAKIYNYPGCNGGAFWCSSSSKVYIGEGASIENCYAANAHGVIGTYEGCVYINGGTITGNTNQPAIGISKDKGKVYITGGTITGNPEGAIRMDKTANIVEISGEATITDNGIGIKNFGGNLTFKDFAGSAEVSCAGTKYYKVADLVNTDVSCVKGVDATYALASTTEDGNTFVHWDAEAVYEDGTFYLSFEDAVDKNAKSGGTLYLKKNVETWRKTAVDAGKEDHMNFAQGDYNLTIDGGGKFSVSGPVGEKGSHRFFVVYSGAKLTLKNLTLDGKGERGFITVHNSGDKPGTEVTLENCNLINGNIDAELYVIGGTLNLINTTVSDTKSERTLRLIGGTMANQEYQVNIKGSTFENCSGSSVIYVDGQNGKLDIDKNGETFTTFKNITGGLGAAVSIQGNAGTISIKNCNFENNQSTNQAAGALYLLSPATIENCTFKGNSSVKGGGAVYVATAGCNFKNCAFKENSSVGSDGGAVYLGAQATLTGCSFKDNSSVAGAGVFVPNGKTLTLRGENSFVGGTVTSAGGAIYLQGTSILDVAGKLTATGNTLSGAENNIHVEKDAMINVTGALDKASVIGINKTYSASTIAKATAANLVNPAVFKADTVPAGTTVTGAYFHETIGDGMLTGGTDAVIDMTDVLGRADGRELDIVLHWPWMFETSNGSYGYVSLHSAYHSRHSGTIYAQKDMNVDYQWGSEITKDSTEAEYNAVFAKTEFPVWTFSTSNKVATNLNHIDIAGHKHMHLDGNGHVITADASPNYIFVIYQGSDVVFENIIYNSNGVKGFANINNGPPSDGTETLTVKNSYIERTGETALAAGYGGKVTIEDSSIKGNITIRNGSELILNGTNVDAGEGKAVDISGSAAVSDNPETEKDETAPERRSGITILNDTDVKVLYIDGNLLAVTIDGSFSGKVNVSTKSNISEIFTKGEGFTSLKTVESITKAGTNGATCAYFDGKKFDWTTVPALTGATDSGKYDDKTGVIRFLTTFTTAPAEDAVESFGTYALFTDNFTNDMNPAGATLKSFTPETEGAKAPAAAEQAFIVDVIDIPEEDRNTDVNAISFVKLKGIGTPVYYYYTTPVRVGDNAKNLGKKPVDEGQAA